MEKRNKSCNQLAAKCIASTYSLYGIDKQNDLNLTVHATLIIELLIRFNCYELSRTSKKRHSKREHSFPN